MTHTPGPWHVRQCDGGYRPFDAEDLAIVSDGLITPALVWGGSNEQEANARLIAAAPDMLAALKDLLRASEAIGVFKNGVEHNGLDEGEMIVSGYMDIARAAIAKATGGVL